MNKIKQKPAYPVAKYLEGSFAPIFDEQVVEMSNMTVIGEVPFDLNGIYVRNGPNQRHQPVSQYHRYDGDGMLHALEFHQGQVTYRNRWIRTSSFCEEENAGHGIYHGMLGDGRNLHPQMPVKDTSNTDVVLHAGKILTMWYLSGEVYQVDPKSLETLANFDFNGQRCSKVSAHGKTDENTDEFVFFDYNREAPYMHCGVVNSKGDMTNFIPVELPGPRMPHDMWMSAKYTVLHDLPLIWDEEAYKAGRTKLKFESDWATRFAVVPRHGKPEDIRWVEFEPCYILHTINAWEEGHWLHMTGHRIEPFKDKSGNPELSSITTIMGRHKLNARLYRWSVNLTTGDTREGKLDDQWNAEFPTWNNSKMGSPMKYAYCTHIVTEPLMHFAGLIKFDLETGSSEYYTEGDNFTYSESPFAPADNAASEDHGYLISFVRNKQVDQSEVHIFDAQALQKGPICKLILPCRVPEGFHATWARGDLLGLSA